MARPILQTGPDPTFDSRVEDVVRRVVRQEAAQLIGRTNAAADAQSSGQGVGIQNVRRGVGRAQLSGLGSPITVSATSFAALSTPLVLDMVLSGRPLSVTLTGLAAAGAGGLLVIDVLLRGVSVTGTGQGIHFTNSTSILGFTGFEEVMEPGPGPARLEVVAARGTADGTIYADSVNRLVLVAKED